MSESTKTTTKKAPAKKPQPQGLVLRNENQPAEPHFLPGVPGLYCPHRATPVGGEGEMSLASAQRVHKNDNLPLELVELDPAEVDELRELAREDRDAARRALRKARKTASNELEKELVSEQLSSLTSQEPTE